MKITFEVINKEGEFPRLIGVYVEEKGRWGSAYIEYL